MAKKDKNSLLNIYYSRTMTSDNLSKAANYVGKHVLKGLGAFGKIMTAPFVQQGPTSATIYKSKKQLAKERTIENKSEELLGKAMTWVSPLNYGTAVWNGHGLNAKKGEEEVASWSPAWQAVGRLGELYVGPKVVKGVKATPRVVVNATAKAGIKPAKAVVVAREIKLAIKNKPNIEVPKPIIRTKVGDVEIDNPQLFYRQGSAEMGDDFIKSGVVRTSGGFENPMYTEGALFKKVPTRTKGGLSKKDKIALEGPYSKTKSDLLVTDSSVDMIPADQSSGKNYTWFEDYMLDPFAEELIFDKSRVPLFNGTATSANTTVYTWKPGYGYKKVVQEPSTSLKFFERKPSKITEAERLGVPKGERNLSNIISRFGEPFTYDENGLFIPNSNYSFRNGWGLILDAIKTRRIRVPEGDYKSTVLKKYPFLKNSIGPFSTVRDLSFNFPYFLRGESIWPFKTQVLAEDLIVIPNNLSGVSWNKVSKFNTIFEDEIANVGDKTTPIINGKSNIFPSDKALFFKLNKATNKYEPYEIIPTSEGWGVYSNKYNKGFSTTYFKYPNYMDEPINIKKKKQGGKMNILEFLKNGSGIHIKKKNRGKFTSYCGGKVTDECILKGKNSSNPAIRKRATFADNARHFKHKEGGKAFVEGVNVLDSNPKAYKYVKKKYQMALEGTKLNFWLKTGNFLNGRLGQTLVNGIAGVIKTTAENKNVDAQAKAAQALNEADWALMMNLIVRQNLEENNRNYMQWVSAYLNGLIQDLPSLIVTAHMGLEKLNQDLSAGKQNLKNKNNQISSVARAAKSENWANTFGNIVQQGMGTIGQLIGNNTNSGTTSSKTNFGTSDYKLQLPEIWTNPTLFDKK